jgi:hypothetical protein
MLSVTHLVQKAVLARENELLRPKSWNQTLK